MMDLRAKLGALAILILVGTAWAGAGKLNRYPRIKGVMNHVNAYFYVRPEIEKMSEGFITDVNRRGPAMGTTPVDFECDDNKVTRLIALNMNGGHLSTEELLYVLQAYEVDYRIQMKHPKRRDGLLRRKFYASPPEFEATIAAGDQPNYSTAAH